MDAGTGQIVAAALKTKDVDDGSQAGPLLGQVTALWPHSLPTALTTRRAFPPRSP